MLATSLIALAKTPMAKAETSVSIAPTLTSIGNKGAKAVISCPNAPRICGDVTAKTNAVKIKL